MTLASIVSKAALVFAVLFMIGAVQLSGVLDASPGSWECSGSPTTNAKPSRGNQKRARQAYYLAALLVIARVEATLFLGLGAGAVYALAHPEGTREVAVVHLCTRCGPCVCLVHADGAGLLPRIGARPNVQTPYEKIHRRVKPGVLNWSAFALSASAAPR